MSLSVFLVVLAAAALHAGWNSLVKGAEDKLIAAVAISAFASLIAAALLPFLPAPHPSSWPFIAASTALQVVYYALVAGAYRSADMSLAYPVMRGGAPLVTALAMGLVFGEAMPAAGWAGVGLISTGILAMALAAPGAGRAGLGFALANVGVIAGYTLVDGFGVRLSGAPVAYTLWIFLLTGPPLVLHALLTRRARLAGHLARHWPQGLAGAAGTMLSYGAALWAMTQAPVAMVAALRECSILFAAAISVAVLGERPGRARIAGIAAVAAGAGALRLAG